MSVKVRLRKDTKEPRWQVDIWARPQGELAADRFRFTAPRNVTSKSGAQRWGEQVRRDIETSGRSASPKGKAAKQAREAEAALKAPTALTLREGAEIYLSDAAGRGNAASTIKSKRIMLASILAVIGDEPVETLGEPEASRVRSALKEAGLRATTINARIHLLQSVLYRLHLLRKRSTPAPKLETVKERTVKVPKAYDDPTFEAMVEEAEHLGPEYHALFLVLGEAALRVGELIGLEVRDFDEHAQVLHVLRSVAPDGEVTPPKNGDPRDVPLTPRLVVSLARLTQGRDPAALLFEGRYPGARLSRSGVRARLERVQFTLGLPYKGPHSLRHTCATSALGGGADPVAVQKLLGHRRLRTTVDLYCHDTGDAPQRAIEALTSARSKAPAGVTDTSRAPRSHGRRHKKEPKP